MNSTTKKINAMVIVNQHWMHRLNCDHLSIYMMYIYIYTHTSTQNKDSNIQTYMYMDDKNSVLMKTKFSSSMSKL